MTISSRSTCAVIFPLCLFLSVSASSCAAETVMTLADCIATTLRENRTIKNAYLDRVVQKYDLRMAEDKFVPTLTLAPSINSYGSTTALGGGLRNNNAGTTLTSGAVATLTENLPAGGTLSLNTNYVATSTEQTSPGRDYGWNVTLT